jgi:hypothetical protein
MEFYFTEFQNRIYSGHLKMCSEQQFYSSPAGSKTHIQGRKQKEICTFQLLRFFFLLEFFLSQIMVILIALQRLADTTANSGAQTFWAATLLTASRSTSKGCHHAIMCLEPVVMCCWSSMLSDLSGLFYLVLIMMTCIRYYYWIHFMDDKVDAHPRTCSISFRAIVGLQ